MPGETTPSTVRVEHVLAHPTRRRIADLLAASPDGTTVAELTEATGLHHNAVRLHLKTLAAAGHVVSQRDRPKGPGRPTDRYRLVDPAAPRMAAHRELVQMLVGLAAELGAEPAAVERFGREHGAAYLTGTGRAGVVGSMAALGFAPRDEAAARDAADGRLALRLCHCPFREAVLAPGGGVVCDLHRGLLDGMARAAAPEARLEALEVHDPDAGRCLARLTGLHEGAPPAA